MRSSGRAEALGILLRWWPAFDETRMLSELRKLRPHGTAVYVSNLWETEKGEPELDVFSDTADVRTRSAEEEEEEGGTTARRPPPKDTRMIDTKYYGHRYSLRAYLAILYREYPPAFAITLRGKRVEPRNILKDLKHKRKEVYKPQGQAGSKIKVLLGFAREAPNADVSGFNLYHRNRLIKPMWKVYHPPSSVGRGVVGVLEVDLIEPSHDKQDFERTGPMAKLEERLKKMQIRAFSGALTHTLTSRAGP